MIYDITYEDETGRKRFDLVPADSKEAAVESFLLPFLPTDKVKIISVKTL